MNKRSQILALANHKTAGQIARDVKCSRNYVYKTLRNRPVPLARPDDAAHDTPETAFRKLVIRIGTERANKILSSIT